MSAHAAAAVAAAVVLPGWIGLALGALLLALGAAAARDRALLHGARAPQRLEINAEGKACIILTNGDSGEALPVGGAGISPHWVALRLRGLPARRSLLLTTGMLGDEPARRLRLWALWRRPADVASRQLSA